MFKKFTKEQFIEKVKLIHEDKYDYSLVNYINNRTKVKIICPIHGEYEQLPLNHLNNKHGCKKCSNSVISEKLTLDLNEIIKKCQLVHNNKYDYSKINYTRRTKKINIICPVHGLFTLIADSHINGQQCVKCWLKEKEIKFITNSNKIHDNKYDYSDVKYINCAKKVKIICPKHGMFKQTPNRHVFGCGCPHCNCSKGEESIKKILISKSIKFYFQKRFKNCKDKRELPFDFYIPKYNLCIEFNGAQHYKNIEYFHSITLEERQYKDAIKYNYCKNNNINFLIIKYSDNIEEKLKEYFI